MWHIFVPRHIEGGGDFQPHWSWRSRLVARFMKRGRNYTCASFAYTSKGELILLISNWKSEIIAFSGISGHMLENLKVQLEQAIAHQEVVK